MYLMKYPIYILSGLGADKRIFNKIDFFGNEIKYIDWIIPTKEDTLNSYVNKLILQIDHPNPILIGLSFGGMVAIEISKLINTEKIILISSSKTKYELPYYYRWIGFLGIHKMIPTKLLMTPNRILYWLFGVETKEEEILFNTIIKDINEFYLRWSIDKIVNWENTLLPKNITHIHGTNDKILPYKFVKCDITIPDGGHFMTYNNSNTLSVILKKLL